MLDRLFDPLLRAMLRPPVRPARALPEELARAAEDVTIAGARMPLMARAPGRGTGGMRGVHPRVEQRRGTDGTPGS